MGSTVNKASIRYTIQMSQGDHDNRNDNIQYKHTREHMEHKKELMRLEKQSARATRRFLEAETKERKEWYWLKLERIKKRKQKVLEKLNSEQ